MGDCATSGADEPNAMAEMRVRNMVVVLMYRTVFVSEIQLLLLL